MLDNKEKAIYDTIIENYILFNSSFEVDMSTYDYKYASQYLEKAAEVVSAITMDHPELIHVGLVTLQTRLINGIVIITPSYVMTKDEYENNTISEEVFEELLTTLNEYLQTNNSHNFDFSNLNSELNRRLLFS